MQSVTITVNKPQTLAKGLEFFNIHLAISNAETKFWDMKLCKSAILGKVKETDNSFEVEFLYKKCNQPLSS